jgi:catechol-2,3-dioxygenase
MKIKALGHVVVRVTDLARAEQFYGGLLGLPIIARYDENGMKMTFFTLGNHHDFAVMEVSGKSLYFADPDGNGVELYIDASDVWRGASPSPSPW